MSLIPAEVLGHFSHSVAMLPNQERYGLRSLLGNLPATARSPQNLRRDLCLTCDLPKYLIDGLFGLPLFCLSKLPADLFAKSLITQKALVFHGIIRFIMLFADTVQDKSLIPLIAREESQYRFGVYDLGRAVYEITSVPAVSIPFGTLGESGPDRIEMDITNQG